MSEILKLSKERREQLYKTIGESFADTMLIAKEKDCPMYSDDHGTRGIAQSEFGVKGFWTQALAILGLHRKLISSEELEKINASLCSLNYRHTTISGQTLFHAAKTAGWTNTDMFTIVLDTLNSPTIELRSSMIVIVDFFYRLWKEPVLSDFQREALVFAVLDTIAQRKSRIEILKFAAVLIPNRFLLIPIAGKHLLKLLAAWRSLRV